MSTSIINDPSIRFVANIDWSKTSEILEVPNLFRKYGLTPNNVTEEKFRNLKNDKIIDISKRLNDLQADLIRYNPSLIQRIINFFTGRLFTICRLRSILPDVIKTVNGVATKILEVQKKADEAKIAAKLKQDAAAAKAIEDARKQQEDAAKAARKAAELARIAAITNQKKAAELAQKRAAAAAAVANQQAAQQAAQQAQAAAQAALLAGQQNAAALAQAAAQAQAALVAAQNKASAALAATQPDDTQDEAAIERGEIIRVNESNLPITAEEMQHKKALVDRVIKNIDNYVASYDTSALPPEAIDPNAPPEAPPYPIEVAKKIQKYANTLFAKLSKNINVPLPRWCHTTGRYGDPYGDIKKIISSGYLWQLGAPRGYGTYLSSLDEAHNNNSYGMHTLVFDECTLSEDVLNPIPKGQTQRPKVTEIHYFPGDPQGNNAGQNRNTSLWLRVRCLDAATMSSASSGIYTARQNCVPVTPHTVAYVCTVANEVSTLRRVFNDLNFKVSVLDRTEVDFMRFVFDAAETQVAALPRHFAQDKLEKAGQKKQESLVKFRNKDTDQLVYVGGRHIPLHWIPHERRENFHVGFPRHMGQLAYLANNAGAKLMATFAE